MQMSFGDQSVERTNVVAVQGAIQLASAVAAMRQNDRLARSQGHQVGNRNHLIVHDLFCPDAQGEEFAACIFQLARTVAEWDSIRYIDSEEMAKLKSTIKWDGDNTSAKTWFKSEIDTGCTEINLFLGQNLLFFNKVLEVAVPDASTYCYGDGLALNFTPRYYAPIPSATRRLRWGQRLVERIIRRPCQSLKLPPLKNQEFAVDFDHHFLLLANHFDETLDHFHQVKPKDFKQIFEAFAQIIDQQNSRQIAELESAIAESDNISVLLTSNFSETNRMSIKDEVTASIELLDKGEGESKHSLLLIKPHPRDSHAKIEQIKEKLGERFGRVIALNDAWTFYLPFESIYLRFLLPALLEGTTVDIACTSSACISLEYLYQQACTLGFGEKTVRKTFSPKWRELRCMHERDLRTLQMYIRNSQALQAA